MQSAGGAGAVGAAIERIDYHERNAAHLLLRRHLYR